MESDYEYYNDNFTPDKNAECEYCGKMGANYYNAFGQQLNFGGFDTDKLLCDDCAKKEFENKNNKEAKQ